MTGRIIEITIPSEEFALEHTLAELESVTFEVERMAATNHEAVMPFIWANSPDRATLEAAFAKDDSVANF